MENYVKVLKQLVVTAAQSFKYVLKGKFRVGFYWFAVRNYVSLFENRNNARRSRYERNGLSLDRDCFAELPPLSPQLSDALVGHFLQRAPGEHGATSFAAYCDHVGSPGTELEFAL